MTRSLGTCRMPVGDGICGGQLWVDQEIGDVVQAVCDRCGIVAGRPISRPKPSESEKAESVKEEAPWWFDK